MYSGMLSVAVAAGVVLSLALGASVGHRKIVSVSNNFVQKSGTCEYTAPSGHTYDFGALQLPSGRDYAIQGGETPREGFLYYYNFCNGVAEHKGTDDSPNCFPTDAACQMDPRTRAPPALPEYIPLGKLDQARWSEMPDGKGVTVTYTGGSSWPGGGKPRSVTVELHCATATRFGPGISNGDSTYNINISTRYACPEPVVPATCQQVLYEKPNAIDGEYKLKCSPADVEFTVWCHGMATGEPTEFVSVIEQQNFASYYQDQSHPPKVLTTHFSKYRINPCSLFIDMTDYTFATTTGSEIPFPGRPSISRVPAGTAWGCSDDIKSFGTGSVDVTGTGLALDTKWQLTGRDPHGSAVLAAANLSVRLTGGGDCGEIVPVGYNPVNPTNPHYALHLKKIGVPPGPPPPPPMDVRWVLSDYRVAAGETCTQRCARLLPFTKCSEKFWPQSALEFSVIVKQAGASCDTVSPGNYASNPQIVDQNGQNQCYWQGAAPVPTGRCDLATNRGHSRFCPCIR